MHPDHVRNGTDDYVALCRRHVAKQRRRIFRLERRGWSTARARDFLETFEFSLTVATQVADGRRHVGEVETGVQLDSKSDLMNLAR